MIRDAAGHACGSGRIPRASGDDPVNAIRWLHSAKYSPRERG